MKQLGRTQRVYQAAIQNSDLFSPEAPQDTLRLLRVTAIAERAGVAANNASTELRKLLRQGVLLRVNSRPALYCVISSLESKLHKTVPHQEFPSVDSFLSFLCGAEQASENVELSSLSGLHPEAKSLFEELIGFNLSLREPIEMAKAALLYPPNGLHTLLTGATGVGKSQFANCMYDFARRSGRIRSEAKLVTFNCANYADNPQLLMSNLFGYIKGAYTGAVRDQPGLIEYANGGILFLDEIHRLHPEGQEKLFHLIDNGTFRRMGETGEERTAQTLIIGATTESPEQCMLSTFLRRIPVHIGLPQLAERSIHERLELALYFIWKESQVLKHCIYLDVEILNALIHYYCPNNIGQLSSDIRLTCANAYFQFLTHQIDLLKIKLPYLSAGIQKGLFTSRGASSQLVRENMQTSVKDIIVNGALPFANIRSQYLSENAVY